MDATFHRRDDSVSVQELRMFGCAASIAMSLCCLTPSNAYGQDIPNVARLENTSKLETDEMKEDTKYWNLSLPTLGGKQFWTDYRWWNGWRVQYNGTLGHWRLIDPNSIRRAWGGRQAMLDELAKVVASANANVNTSVGAVAEPTEVVLLLHGLMRSASSMEPIEREVNRVDALSSSTADPSKTKRTVIGYSYASTREPISNHSAALRELVENLPGQPRISLVGHSMGNIVFRHAIGEWQRNGDPKQVLPRLHRAVMLGPPNQGSAFAAKLSKLGLFEVVTGNAGMQLGPSWDTVRDGLGTPPCPFAVVAGDISKSTIQNPLLAGPSDGVVTMEEAALDGMAEMVAVPVMHSFLMSDPKVVRGTVAFLSGGSLQDSIESRP
jgi:pimeloyl-ACP methyl ester carboxylesterase